MRPGLTTCRSTRRWGWRRRAGLCLAGSRGWRCVSPGPERGHRVWLDRRIRGLKCCTTRQPRRRRPALSYYACSSWLTRQASPLEPGLSCSAGSGRVRWRRPPSPSPQPRLPGRPVKGGRERGWVRAPAGRRSPWSTRSAAPTPRLCPESVTGNLHSASTLAPGASPVVLRMLFMHSSTGLAIWAGIVVLCRFWTGAMAPAPAPFPSRVYRAARQSGPRVCLAPAGSEAAPCYPALPHADHQPIDP